MTHTAAQLRDLLARAGISQRAAARALQIDNRLMRRYCSGAIPVPEIVWMALITLMNGRSQ